jgi:hypothetical protein
MRYEVFRVGALFVWPKRKFEDLKEAKEYAKAKRGCVVFDLEKEKIIDPRPYQSPDRLTREFGSEFEARIYLKQCELERVCDGLRIARLVNRRKQIQKMGGLLK